jgi:VIT1/CCC1 family predicted Fe2+/Mn2+ transporter
VSIPPLERAIALLEQGKRSEAQKLLQALIAEDQHHLAAWFWLVETCTTNQQRLHVVEMCLEYNPENEQARQAWEKLRTLSPAQLATKVPRYKSSEQQLTNWEAAGMGVLLAVGAALLLLMILPASGYFALFVILALILGFPLGITGALLGKLLTKTRNGTWLGAAIMIVLGCWWINSVAARLPLD